MFRPEAAEGLEAWLEAYLTREGLCFPGERWLVAVSGGPDSVALLHLLARLRQGLGVVLGVAHFNHGLRGEDSWEDARFVARLAAELDLPLHAGTGDVQGHSRRRKISLQMAARELRRTFFREICRQYGYERTVLGHTADDQVELFFLRLLRGAGLTGLKGMWPLSAEGYLRPLLGVGKEPLLAWLKKEHLAFREDQSNLSPRYVRNRVRLELLPELARHYNPQLKEGVWRLMARLQEDERLLTAQVAALWPQVGRVCHPDLVVLRLPVLLSLAPGLQNRLLQTALGQLGICQPLTAHQLENLLALARGRQSGGLLSLPECRVARAGKELHFLRPLPPPPSAAQRVRLAGPGTIITPSGWQWMAEMPAPVPGALSAGPDTVWLAGDGLDFPLELRHPQPGDRFWPAGTQGARKLQDVLVDRKIPRWLRPYLPVAACRGLVVWVAGVQAAQPAPHPATAKPMLMLGIRPVTPEACRIWEYLRAVT